MKGNVARKQRKRERETLSCKKGRNERDRISNAVVIVVFATMLFYSSIRVVWRERERKISSTHKLSHSQKIKVLKNNKLIG